MPTLDSMVVYHIQCTPGLVFFSIDGFDLICLIIGLKFYFDSYILLMVLNLIYTLKYEKINVQDYAKIRMFFRENFVIN